MRLVVASDEKTNLTDFIVQYLQKKGYELVLLGYLVNKNKKWKWAEIGREAAQKIVNGEVEQGILLCWSGGGICMAANRFKGVRAALCWEPGGAAAARKWDNANVLCLSYRYTTPDLAKEILDAWFATKFDEEGLNQAHKLDE